PPVRSPLLQAELLPLQTTEILLTVTNLLNLLFLSPSPLQLLLHHSFAMNFLLSLYLLRKMPAVNWTKLLHSYLDEPLHPSKTQMLILLIYNPRRHPASSLQLAQFHH